MSKGAYEPGAIPLAEAHFATPETRTAFKLLVVKYQGPGDDPAAYCVRHELNRLHVENDLTPRGV